MNEQNEISNIVETNTIQNTTVEDMTAYDVCKSINTVVSVIAFTIIVIFMFKYLKDTFKK